MNVITFIFKSLEDAQDLISSRHIAAWVYNNEIEVLFDPKLNEVSFKLLGDEEDNKRIYRGIVDLVEFYSYYN